MSGNNTPYEDEFRVNKKDESDATTSFILSIIAAVFAFGSGFSIIGFVCGIIAVVKAAPLRRENKYAKIGWILGIVAICLTIFGAILMFATGQGPHVSTYFYHATYSS
jgi:predicted membrane protein